MPDVRAGFSANDEPVNVAALAWLRVLNASPDPHQPFLMTLLLEALDRGAFAPGMSGDDRAEMEQAVLPRYSRPPQRQMQWLLTHPNLSQQEQTDNLLNLLAEATTPEQAMSRLLEATWDRMKAEPDAGW